MRRPAILFLLIIVLASGTVLALLVTPRPPGAEAFEGPVGGAFTLVDETGRTVTDQTYAGRWLVIAFGYTWCPDTCPASLGNLATALAEMGPVGERVQPLFISVDPARDTPSVLAAYTRGIDERIMGLTGTPAQVAAILRAYHASAVKVMVDGGYLYSHTMDFFLMGPDGRYVATLPADAGADRLAQELLAAVAPSS